jgi:hypothetical protein
MRARIMRQSFRSLTVSSVKRNTTFSADITWLKHENDRCLLGELKGNSEDEIANCQSCPARGIHNL